MEFYSKNKFEKLVHLVGFIIRVYILIRVTQSLLPHKLSLQLVNSRHHTAATAPLRLNYDPPSWFHTIPPVGSLRSPQLVPYDRSVGSLRSPSWFLPIARLVPYDPPGRFLTIPQLVPYDRSVGSLRFPSWFLTIAQLVPYDPPGRFLTIPQLVPYDRSVDSLRSPSWFLTMAQLVPYDGSVGSLRSPRSVPYDPPVGSLRSLSWFLTIPPVGSSEMLRCSAVGPQDLECFSRQCKSLNHGNLPFCLLRRR